MTIPKTGISETDPNVRFVDIEKQRIAYRTAPLTAKQILELVDANGRLSGNIVVNINETVGLDFERFLDLVSERLINSPLLMDSSYEPVTIHPITMEIIVKVSGKVDTSDMEVEA